MQHAQNSKFHETATMRATEFKRLVENKANPIDVQINNTRQDIIERNRVRPRTIIDTIMNCGRQNIPLG